MNNTALTETYAEVREAVVGTARKFQARYGGDSQELLAQANLLFVTAVRDYLPDRGQFLPWLRFRVWTGLAEMTREELRRHKSRNSGLDVDTIPRKAPSGLTALLVDLSNDARALIALLLDPPPAALFNARVFGSPRVPDNLFDGVCTMLSACGWGDERLDLAIREVEEALK